MSENKTDIKELLKQIKQRRKEKIIRDNTNSSEYVFNINDIELYKTYLESLKLDAIKDRTGRENIRLSLNDFQTELNEIGLNVDFGNDVKNITRVCVGLNNLNKRHENISSIKWGYRNNKDTGNIDIKVYTDYKPIKRE